MSRTGFVGSLLLGAAALAVAACSWGPDQVVGSKPRAEGGHTRRFASHRGELRVEPGVVLLGQVAAGATTTEILAVRNVGEGIAYLEEVDSVLAGASLGDLVLAPALPLPRPLGPGESLAVALSYSPGAAGTGGNAAVGALRFATRSEDPLWVPVYAMSVVPSPPELELLLPGGASCLDLGEIATGVTREKEVTLANPTDYPVWVGGFEVAGQAAHGFGLRSDSFGPALPEPVPAFLKPHEQVRLVLYNDNDTVDVTQAKAEIRVVGAGGAVLSESCAVAALVGPKQCHPVVAPSPKAVFLAVGALRYGDSVAADFTIHSAGTGPCVLPPMEDPDRLTVAGCDVTEPQGFACGAASGEGVVPSPWFVAEELPPPGLLEPGETAGFRLRFTPPAVGPLPGPTTEAFGARLRVRLLDPYHDDAPVLADLGFEGEKGQPNIVSVAAGGVLLARPLSVDFGPLTSGCGPSIRSIWVTNRGAVWSTVSDVGLVGECGSAVVAKLGVGKAAPAKLPVVLWPNDSLEVVLAANGAIPDGCALEVLAQDGVDGTLVVPVRGSVARSAARSAAFAVPPAPQVDVLLVADTSPSMGGYVKKVESLASALVWAGAVADVRVAVVAADAAAGAELLVDQWIRADAPDAFAVVAGAATEGGGSAHEQGLEAAWLVASTPGQLRENATLEVIVVSDEDDMSPSVAPLYGDLLERLKGPGNEHMVRVHAVVGTKGADCGSLSPDVGSRYAKVAAYTKGMVASICGADFTPHMQLMVGSALEARRTHFQLSSAPDPGSPIAVSVDGTPCSVGWSFHEATGSLTFDEASPCAPAPGDLVEVSFTAACTD